MSTLYSLSCFLGRAMNLPPVFFRKVPYVGILDQKIRLTDFIGPRNRRKRRFKQARSRATSMSSTVPAQPVMLEGAISLGSETKYAIDGVDFTVTPGTWIIGEPHVGCRARVKGARHSPSLTVTASSIVVLLGRGEW